MKDDSTCLCADLVAGTHGRGFWILDDVTPLRQAAAMRAAASAGGVSRSSRRPAVRVRFGMNDPTPWPPELPAGENPPPGAHHRLLPAVGDDAGAVKLEILDAAGKVVRTYSSTDPVRNPDPAIDPGRVQQALPGRRRTLPDCGLPLYWPAPPHGALDARRACTASSWDMHYDPLAGGGGGGRGGGGGGGAVPHRTYPGGQRAVGAARAPTPCGSRSTARARRSRSRCSSIRA